MAMLALKQQGVDGRVKHGHDGVGGWVIGQMFGIRGGLRSSGSSRLLKKLCLGLIFLGAA
jgi:hypothetical protein